MEQVRRYLKKIIKLIKQPEMRIMPGHLAFFFVMAIIPLVALIGLIASKFSISTNLIQNGFNIKIPAGVEQLLITIVSGKGFNFNMGVFLVSAFILASNGTHSIIVASNEAYKIEPNGFFSRRLKAVLMTLIILEVIFFILIIPVFGDNIFNLLREHFGSSNSISLFYKFYILLKYPLSIIIIYFNIKLIYVIAPDAEIASSTATKGAIFTTISWILASEIYSFYLDTFTKYDIFYGSISNIIILLLWVYMLCYIFVLGLIINAGSYQNMLENQK